MNKSLYGKKALVVGLGKSGIAATQALLKLGVNVTVQDSKERNEMDNNLVSFLEGVGVTSYFAEPPKEEDVFDIVVLSPGVPLHIDFIDEAKKKGAEIVGELEIAYRISRGTYVAITGTNGKTTTTKLVGEIFQEAKRRTYVVGNIGVAVISRALIAPLDSWLITEVSSFQLETTKTFHPKVSAILNITEDHMDRHQTMDKYIKAKAKIFKNQGPSDFTVLNYDDLSVRKLCEETKATCIFFSNLEEVPLGCYVENGEVVIKDIKGEKYSVIKVEDIPLPGDHNLENVLAACAISFFSGIDPVIIGQGIRNFRGVPHRLEYVREVDGVSYINDSKATNPQSTIKAIQAYSENLILIMGGYDKKSSYEELISSFGRKVKEIILLGKTAKDIEAEAQKQGFTNITIVKDMPDAVKVAYEKAKKGDTVLLSPACASWDMYDNFEQRGEHFKTLVNGLLK